MSDKPVKNVVSFSGGKDSTALLLWAREHLERFETVWMDTGWEHPLTYGYVDYIDEEVLGGACGAFRLASTTASRTSRKRRGACRPRRLGSARKSSSSSR